VRLARSHQIKPLFSELNVDTHRQIVAEVSQKTAANNQQYFAVEYVFQIGGTSASSATSQQRLSMKGRRS
jgi:hypothetical protein